MVRTRVGYAGGTLANPTYYNLGDHTETIEMDYDPDVITYTELLAIFGTANDPHQPILLPAVQIDHFLSRRGAKTTR